MPWCFQTSPRSISTRLAPMQVHSTQPLTITVSFVSCFRTLQLLPLRASFNVDSRSHPHLNWVLPQAVHNKSPTRCMEQTNSSHPTPRWYTTSIFLDLPPNHLGFLLAAPKSLGGKSSNHRSLRIAYGDRPIKRFSYPLEEIDPTTVLLRVLPNDSEKNDQ